MANIAGIYWDDTAAAPGISLSVYFSGCHFHCPGCHNPEAQAFDYGEPFTSEVLKEILKKLNKNGVKRRLSILGGEPLCEENLFDVFQLIMAVKMFDENTEIFIWSGYTYEQLKEREKNEILLKSILQNTTCLIDGLYEQDKRDTTLPMRGSSNQRIIYLENGNAK